MKRKSHRSSMLLAAALLVGCEVPTTEGPPGAPAKLEIAGGTEQAGIVGVELPEPLVVRLVDGKGRGIPGVVVQWSITAGNGTLVGPNSRTDEAGEAHNRWTLGTTAGPRHRTEARVTTGRQLVLLTVFDAVASAHSPDAIVDVRGNRQVGAAGTTLGDSLSIRIVDQFMNPVPALAVQWTASAGELSATTTQTRLDGTTKVGWRLGTGPGVQSVRVVAAELSTELTATVQ